MLLARVTHVGEALYEHIALLHPLGRQHLHRQILHFEVNAVQALGLNLIGARDERADVVTAQIGHQHPPGGEDCRLRGDDDLVHPQLAHQRSGVHRASAAEGDEREVTRIVTAPHRDQLERVDHVGVGNADDSHGRLLEAHLEGIGDGLQGRFGLLDVQGNLAPQEVVRVNPAGQDVGVGHRGLVASPTIAGWARICPRADRTDPQRTGLVDPGNRAAPGSDLHNVDRGRQDGVSGKVASMLDAVFRGDLGRAFFHQRGLGGRATDVQRNHVLLADHLADLGCTDDACDGS